MSDPEKQQRYCERVQDALRGQRFFLVNKRGRNEIGLLMYCANRAMMRGMLKMGLKPTFRIVRIRP